jgi:hypothetical protein
MPGKLKVAVALMVLSAGMNFLAAKWLSVLIVIALIIGVLRGSEGSRVIVLGFGVLGFIASVVTILLGLGHPLPMIVGLFGAAQSGFTVYCMNDGAVQDWMYKRSLPDSVRDL